MEQDAKAVLVKKRMEEDFNNINEQEIEIFFDKFVNDTRNRTVDFIKYYNKTVLDKERIKFNEFKYQWAIQGMTKEVYTYFDKNYDKLIDEIRMYKDIDSFFKNYCCMRRKEASFCSKLFHTILPSEFPPVDNPIKKKFNLQNEDFIKSVLVIKKGYELFIKEKPATINLIRKVLSKNKFSYIRVNELSDIRILDMYYWFKENRDAALSQPSYTIKLLNDFSALKS